MVVEHLHKNKLWVFQPKFSILDKYVLFIWGLFTKPYITNYNLKNNCKEVYIDCYRPAL
jgi:hypothetical protein